MSLAKKTGIFAVMMVLAVAGVCIAFAADADTSDAAPTYKIQYEIAGTIYAFEGTDEVVQLKTVEALGYTLADGKKMSGWLYSETTIVAEVGSSVTLTSTAKKFVAQITDIKYTVIFQTMDKKTVKEGGVDVIKDVATEIGKKADYVYNDTLVAPADPVKEGYVFDNWGVETLPTKVTADATYTAVWREIHAITWYVEGVKIATGTSEQAATYAKPADPVKDSFRFLGWFDDDGKVCDATYKYVKDTVMTAKFEASVYKVIFVQGDTALYTMTVAHGDKAIMPEAPAGWKWNFDFDTAITAATTISASEIPKPDTSMSSGEQIMYFIAGIIGVSAVCGVGYAVKIGKITLRRKP